MRRLFLLSCFVVSFWASASMAGDADSMLGVWAANAGKFSVHLKKVDFSYECSFVLADIRHSAQQIQIETLFDCEDGETQMIPNMYFDLKGDELWLVDEKVGTYSKDLLFVLLPVRENGYELYALFRNGDKIDYLYEYSMDGVQISRLKSTLDFRF